MSTTTRTPAWHSGYAAGAEDARFDDHLAQAEPHEWARCSDQWRNGYQYGWDEAQ